MATPFVHTLLPFDTYGDTEPGDVEGMGQATVGRTRWDFTLEVASVTSVTVVIQGSAVGDDDEYTTLGTFNGGAIATAGTYTLTSYGGTPDFTVESYHEWLRAKVTAQTGDATVEVTAAAAFVDPTVADDKNLLRKELREWSDGLTRTVEDAERVVRALLLSDVHAGAGVLAIRNVASAYDEVRGAVAKQADWLYGREMLAREKSAAAAGALRRMPETAPAVLSGIRRIQPNVAAYWLGR